MASTRCWVASVILAALPAIAAELPAQRGALSDEWPQPPLLRAVATWMSLAAAPGHEGRAADAIRAAYPGWRRDATGNLVISRGAGRPRRVVACGLDLPAHVVARLTRDGRALLRAVANGDSVRVSLPIGSGAYVIARTGTVRGLVTTDDSQQLPGTALDVGARTAAELGALGIALLDPVIADRPAAIFGAVVAGVGAGSRASCMAVATVAQRTPVRGETIFIISLRRTLAWSGLGAALATLGAVDTIVVVDGHPSAAAEIRDAIGPARGGPAAVIAISPAAAEHGPTESLSELDVGVLLSAVARRAAVSLDLVTGSGRSEGTGGGVSCEVTLASPSVASLPDEAPRAAPPAGDGHEATLARLAPLLAAAGVVGRESGARDAFLAALPAWARERAQIDAAGNLVVAVGPPRDTLLLVASLAEPGFAVTRVAADGVVSLRALGGASPGAHAGYAARLHLPRARATRLRGTCVLDRAAELRSLDGVFTNDARAGVATASFGMDSAALVSFGVAAGDVVTSAGEPLVLRGGRIAARGIAGRAPAAALLLALDRIDPATLARALVVVIPATPGAAGHDAAAFAGARRVHALGAIAADDGSATPRLGFGVSIRALDDASVVTPEALAQVVDIARVSRVPTQTSVAMGTNAGVPFARRGARLVPLDVPVRHERAPMPAMDLDDVEAMAALLVALVRAP